ncbi:UDP-N-acetylmuramoyl-tripeptide--D-alanyl-D-alanine ligase [Candidatus Saccharibacteria bacterium]|nr:UDP-N-acetylmuramoyl-tripeptide--D-alanyl-D-alanine ligase [Candidatus Saccharibacteria bacterium]MCB9834779.1 UDP-N-acetylmuramoyl-tripeptide--D-alanyl-D-alanine ligase [Candidatus Nomurabacteria bacterium]
MRKLFAKFIQIYLEMMVRLMLIIHRPKVIAITGSVGKTTTRSMIDQLLDGKVKYNRGKSGYNTEIGLLMVIFEQSVPSNLSSITQWSKIILRVMKLALRYPYDYLVLEMGADKPGDIAHFLGYIRPDIAIITGIGASHTEGFGSLEAVLNEKWKLAQAARQVVIYNRDFELIRQKAMTLDGNRLSYSANSQDADYCLEAVNLLSQGLAGNLRTPNKELEFASRLVGRVQLAAGLAGLATLDCLGIRWSIDDYNQLEAVAGRSKLLISDSHIRIIDDSYNASAVSILAGLDTLVELAKEGRKTFVFGQINELGKLAHQEHVKVAKRANQLVDQVYGLGPEVEKLAKYFDQASFRYFPDPYSLGEALRQELKSGDTVLVKGSQNQVFSEEVIATIAPELKDQLVRQTPEWRKRKRESFNR